MVAAHSFASSSTLYAGRRAPLPIVGERAQARKPAWKLTIDVGPEVGRRCSSAQLTALYARERLIGQLVLAVMNCPPRRIGRGVSQVLTLGVPADGAVVLVAPERDLPRGGRLFCL
jgi:tRNA-binding protein